MVLVGFPGGLDGKESACKAGDVGSLSGLGRSPGEGNGNPLQYSGLENPTDREAWRTTVYSVAKESDTTGRLNNNNPLPLTPKPQHLCWLPSSSDTGTKGHVSSLCPTYLRALPQMAALHNWAGGDPPDHQGCLHTGLILPPHHLLVPPLIQMLGTH